MKGIAEPLHALRCPACGHEIGGSSIGESIKVRCPRCREVVVLTAREASRKRSVEGSSKTASLVLPHRNGDRRSDPHEILLYVTEHDPESRVQADLLAKILPRAGWEVRDIIAGPLPARCGPGVTFAAAPAIPATRLSCTFNTLREAGFTVTLHLDPSLKANETMLVVVPSATAVATR